MTEAAAGYTYRVQPRFVDADSFGHVNNAVFFSYLEIAREYFYLEEIAAAGGTVTFADLIGPSRAILVSHQEIEYVAPLMFGKEPVHVRVWVVRIGSSSFDLGYEVAESSGALRYAVANTGMVVTSRDSGRAVPLTPTQRGVLEAALGRPVAFRATGATDFPQK